MEQLLHKRNRVEQMWLEELDDDEEDSGDEIDYEEF